MGKCSWFNSIHSLNDPACEKWIRHQNKFSIHIIQKYMIIKPSQSYYDKNPLQCTINQPNLSKDATLQCTAVGHVNRGALYPESSHKIILPFWLPCIWKVLEVSYVTKILFTSDLCRAESVPMVISVPQKSLSIEPTIPTIFRWLHEVASSWLIWFVSFNSLTRLDHSCRNRFAPECRDIDGFREYLVISNRVMVLVLSLAPIGMVLKAPSLEKIHDYFGKMSCKTFPSISQIFITAF